MATASQTFSRAAWYGAAAWFVRAAVLYSADAFVLGEAKGALMGDKSPKKNDAKKPSKSIKEKRADKHAKKGEKRGAMGG